MAVQVAAGKPDEEADFTLVLAFPLKAPEYFSDFHSG
jgi:hypothetical protein